MKKAADVRRCSFCRKHEDDVGRLISNPSDYPRAYICDECIAICTSVIDGDMDVAHEAGVPQAHPVLSHPEILNLMDAIERWIGEESLGKPAGEELNEVRRMAATIFASSPK